MSMNTTMKSIKGVYSSQVEKIVSIIEKFRGDRALSMRPRVRVLGMNFTLCLKRLVDNDLEVMFTDERDNYLKDSYGLNISGVLTIVPEDSIEEIQKKIEAEVSKLVKEYILR